MIHTRNRIFAALIAIFLGNFGLHKFYLGRFGYGIAMLAFSWTFIPQFVAFYHAFKLFQMEDEEFNSLYPNDPPPPLPHTLPPRELEAAERKQNLKWGGIAAASFFSVIAFGTCIEKINEADEAREQEELREDQMATLSEDLREVKNSIDRGEFSSSRQTLAQIDELLPNNSDVDSMLLYHSEAYSTHLVDTARAAIQKNDLETANELIVEYEELNPASETAKQLRIERFKQVLENITTLNANIANTVEAEGWIEVISDLQRVEEMLEPPSWFTETTVSELPELHAKYSEIVATSHLNTARYQLYEGDEQAKRENWLTAEARYDNGIEALAALSDEDLTESHEEVRKALHDSKQAISEDLEEARYKQAMQADRELMSEASELVMATSACEVAVKDLLHSPRSAEFHDFYRTRGRVLEPGIWVLTNTLEAKNRFGVMLRNEYFCKVQRDGESSYRVLKVEIGD